MQRPLSGQDGLGVGFVADRAVGRQGGQVTQAREFTVGDRERAGFRPGRDHPDEHRDGFVDVTGQPAPGRQAGDHLDAGRGQLTCRFTAGRRSERIRMRWGSHNRLQEGRPGRSRAAGYPAAPRGWWGSGRVVEVAGEGVRERSDHAEASGRIDAGRTRWTDQPGVVLGGVHPCGGHAAAAGEGRPPMMECLEAGTVGGSTDITITGTGNTSSCRTEIRPSTAIRVPPSC